MTGLAAIALVLVVVAMLVARLGRRSRGDVRSSDPALGASGADGAPALPNSVRADVDHEFLLARCGGDEQEVFRRLEVEVRRNPNLSDGEAYRRAIRSWFLEKRGGTHAAIAEELDDRWL